MDALYRGVGVFGELRTLHRAVESLESGKRLREMDGSTLTRVCVLLKSLSLPSVD
jgi:hypothetical protein